MKKTKKTAFWTIILSAMLLILTPVTALADMGPKPSIVITFEHLGEELCYATLLSKTDSTGPASVWDGNPYHAKHKGMYEYAALDYDDWKAFAEYQDADGFYFLQTAWQINETKELAWTYYPPKEFKILLYFPETEEFVSSGIYERYAFDSYYTVDMKEQVEHSALNGFVIQAVPAYRYGWEIISLVTRIIITIVIELAAALLFGFREKKQLQFFVVVNLLTQILLNVLLNTANYYAGSMAFVMAYVCLELLVFAVEAIVFRRFLNRFSVKKRSVGRITAYALTANMASFLGGMWIAVHLPGIF